MLIKIIKSSKDSYWYADQIGITYEAIREQEDIFEVIKWVKFPLKYDIAPILKADCIEEYVRYQSVEPPHYQYFVPRVKVDLIKRANRSRERSGFKMIKEIERYEKLNKESEITSNKAELE